MLMFQEGCWVRMWLVTVTCEKLWIKVWICVKLPCKVISRRQHELLIGDVTPPRPHPPHLSTRRVVPVWHERPPSLFFPTTCLLSKIYTSPSLMNLSCSSDGGRLLTLDLRSWSFIQSTGSIQSSSVLCSCAEKEVQERKFFDEVL